MCLAFPGKILSIQGDQAVCDFDGIEKTVNISLVKEAKKSEYVIVHAGFAIQKMGSEDALEVLGLLRKGGIKQ